MRIRRMICVRRSDLYSLNWLRVRPTVWLNVHAGLDQATELLAKRFDPSSYRVFDVFDSGQMTEPSIARARELHGSQQSVPVSWIALPAETATFDAVFVMFAAHEFRKTEPRHVFFAELARVLKPGGTLVLTDHLRDLPNFLAYGPGCFHFQSRATWLAALLGLAHAGFGRRLNWKTDMAKLMLVNRQIFQLHCLYIGLLLVMLGSLSLFRAEALLEPGPLSPPYWAA